MCAHGADAVQFPKLAHGETGQEFEIIDTGPEQCIGQTMSDSVVPEGVEEFTALTGTAAAPGNPQRLFPGAAGTAHIDHTAVPSRP